MKKQAILSKTILDPDWIDLSYGEPSIVRNELLKHIDVFNVNFKYLEYPFARGYGPLVELLEEKYKTKVVITNGAKQGLSAVFFALKKMGCKSIMTHRPYWASTPQLVQQEGLDLKFIDLDNGADSFLLTSPNNPDGKELRYTEKIEMHEVLKRERVFLIHDAAYYTPIYVSNPKNILTSLGDVQVYSFSKMWGLSGLRIGYVVCNNHSFVDYIEQYVEEKTAGVSIASQQIAHYVEDFFLKNPGKLIDFNKTCRKIISQNRALFDKVDDSVLSIKRQASNSMFLWAKKGPKLDLEKVKINAVDGSLFGAPDMIRLNIALPQEEIKAAVERLCFLS